MNQARRAALFILTLVLVATSQHSNANAAAIKMYWTDRALGSISRSDLDGSNRETLISGVDPTGMAVDAAAGKFYFTDHNIEGIQRSNLDGTMLEPVLYTLAEDDHPFAVALLVPEPSTALLLAAGLAGLAAARQDRRGFTSKRCAW